MFAGSEDYVVTEPPGARGDNTIPLVFLFGWAGCRDRYLAKYGAMYDKQNCMTVRYTTPLHKVRAQGGYSGFALHVYEAFADLHAEDRPIVFHVFSMNGCSLFSSLWDLLDSVDDGIAVKARVKGLVFDSCPAHTSSWQSANAISFATMPPPTYSDSIRFLYRCLLAAYFLTRRAQVWIQSWWDPRAYAKQSAYYRMMEYADLPKDQLYLYSKADDICTYESIEEFRATQVVTGARIDAICWPDSPHVDHGRKYPEEYSNACIAFLRKVVRGETGDSSGAEDFERVEAPGESL
uniref:Transmembrane protein 53 n=1 Tax=Plectus sambesii TaxID=2011161 RepID=A0A914WY02_9BILA